ncbi:MULTISPECIES: ABC transporter ATP-binding protein [unclassified Mesorhizobium]|uniref:ABC transporter ATP-binding protein n=1 Tax=unclassified Mesorhizobium TaxID=325217 RepID=UPI001092346C|nr:MULTISPECIES: ABC transporter ATP-binding protein [unclassified Mesorhizobium]TGS43734.1 dipeptide ABC transporter ATP-binding protein [Mesorhizobium sp. M8A.F.Ca.ET.182.01.1.1]TGS78315.1 dipeptide ABC transporter ATP-binding protein [Mesorhizobium sp. M8A.F.Ca.ET.181.01.1.1]TGV15454.1 dipeptide ABC transporter ATP-binding protein [Mesorhizobium sp. M8A.F.Ca.ET.173.01.1.1]
MMPAPVEKAALACEDLSIGYRVGSGILSVVRNVSLRVVPGAAVGIVGESGSGKSTLALALANCMSSNGILTAGSIQIGGENVTRQLAIRNRLELAKSLSVVFQNPGGALDPSRRISSVFDERLRLLGLAPDKRMSRAVALLESVKIRNVGQVLALYPHQLSGGMQQRVVIALALANDLAVLVLDEPTTGLDATVASDIIELLKTLRREQRAGLIFISHDIGQVHNLCDDIAVMYGGELVEQGPADDIISSPRHPYTRALLACLPSVGERRVLEGIKGAPPSPSELSQLRGCLFAPRCDHPLEVCAVQRPEIREEITSFRCHNPILAAQSNISVRSRETVQPVKPDVRLKVDRLKISYGRGERRRQILEDVSFELRAGEILAVVGESGSGKSTLLKGLVGLVAPDNGSIFMNGQRLPASYADRTKECLSDIRIVFQNPSTALNRRRRIGDQIGRCLAVATGRRSSRADQEAQADQVRLPHYNLDTLARSLSGGLLQRVAIACALAGKPQVIVFDEPTSALDVSVQADILNLIEEQVRRTNAAAIFVTHDLAVVRQVADRVMVLLNGKVVECGNVEDVFEETQHVYTRQLLAAFAEKRQAFSIKSSGIGQ